MSQPRKTSFEHDGHLFEVREHADASGESPIGMPHVRWEILMDGRTVLEFSGPFQYRDHDVKKRVLEWYAIQKPVTRPPAAGQGGR